MPNKLTFLTTECARINAERCKSWGEDTVCEILTNGDEEYQNREKNRLIRPLRVWNDHEGEYESQTMLAHGAACVGALRIAYNPKKSHKPGEIDDELKKKHRQMVWGHETHKTEAALWNLSARADIILLPIREYAPIEQAAFMNCLNLARKAGFIADEEYTTFIDDSTFKVLDEATKSGDSYCLNRMISAIMNEIVNSGSSAAPRILSLSRNAVLKDKKTRNWDEEGIGSYQSYQIYEKSLENSIKKLVTCVLPALEEAGLEATFELLLKASESGEYFGRGDTIVVPNEIHLWNGNKPLDRECPPELQAEYERSRDWEFENRSVLDSRYNAKNFFCDRYEESIEDVAGPKLRDISRIEVPIIIYKKVEDKIRSLTCNRKISVIISGGNSRIDLGQLDMEKIDHFLPTKRLNPEDLEGDDREAAIEKVRRRLFQARGCHCGAVIVGSGVPGISGYWMDPLGKRFKIENKNRIEPVKVHREGLEKSLKHPGEDDDHRKNFANYGLCIDAFGRGSARDIHKMDINHPKERVVDSTSYYHWGGASIASMVAAACLANIQHIRLLSDFFSFLPDRPSSDAKEKAGEMPQTVEGGDVDCPDNKRPYLYPLKPYEARAHFRQWRSNESYWYACLEDLMGPPPDIKAWFEGACCFDELEGDAAIGRKLIEFRRDELHSE